MRINYKPFIFLGVVFMIVLYQAKCSKSVCTIDCGVYIHGKITALVRSGDHDFGIYKILVDTCNIQDTSKLHNSSMLPFVIKENWAEIYTSIPPDDSVGYFIEVVSNDKVISVKNKDGKLIGIRDFVFITDPRRIDFIHRNTTLTN